MRTSKFSHTAVGLDRNDAAKPPQRPGKAVDGRYFKIVEAIKMPKPGKRSKIEDPCLLFGTGTPQHDPGKGAADDHGFGEERVYGETGNDDGRGLRGYLARG